MLWAIANVQTAQAGSPSKSVTKREYLKQQGQSASAVAFPSMSKDFLTALETLGVRPGMTLHQAQAEATKWGVTLVAEDNSNAQPLLSPSKPYNQLQYVHIFTYRAQAEKTYRGHPRLFDPTMPNKSWQPGITQVLVFPIDPVGDLYNPDNLIVYYIDTSVFFTGTSILQKGVMSETQFL
jgi:hypothetical protein